MLIGRKCKQNNVQPIHVIKQHLIQLAVKFKKRYKNLDEAMDIITLNSSVMKVLLENHDGVKYSKALHIVENDFLIASKILLLCRLAKYIYDFKSQTTTNVATHILTLLLVIFATEQFVH
jgi:hypothetical protein